MKIDYCQWVAMGDEYFMFIAPALIAKDSVWDYTVRLNPQGEWELTTIRKSGVEQISAITTAEPPTSNTTLIRFMLSLDHRHWMQR